MGSSPTFSKKRRLGINVVQGITNPSHIERCSPGSTPGVCAKKCTYEEIGRRKEFSFKDPTQWVNVSGWKEHYIRLI